MKILAYRVGGILGVVTFVTAVSVFVWHLTEPDENVAVTDVSPTAMRPSDESRIAKSGGRRIAEFRVTKFSTIAATKEGVREEEERSGAEAEGLADPVTTDNEDENVVESDAALSEWDAVVDEIGALPDHAVRHEDQARVNQVLKRVPLERRRESVQALLNMVSDDNFSIVHDLLFDRSQSSDVVQTVYHDLLNRPEEVKIPLLREIAQDPIHANYSEAHRILNVQNLSGE